MFEWAARSSRAAGRNSMKFLYVGFEPVDPGSADYVQSVLGKMTGVKQLGHAADCICRSRGGLIGVLDGETVFLPSEGPRKDGDLGRYALDLLKRNAYDTLYFRAFLLDRTFLELSRAAKQLKFSARVIFEPERYPAPENCKKMLRAFRAARDFRSCRELRRRYRLHRRCLPRMRQAVDVAVVPGVPISELRGIPAISINEGIVVSRVRLKSETEDLDAPILLLGVAEESGESGFERILKGLLLYQSRRYREEMRFDIVGGEKSVAPLKKLAGDLGLEPFVRFLGEKTEEEINDLCCSHTVAVSRLGLFRSGTVYDSPRIAKLFCAAGIPFLYAYEDLSLDTRTPFALKLANLDAPVSMELVGEFVWRCRLNSHLARTERKFAESNYDWRVMMKRILEFTATGRRGV